MYNTNWKVITCAILLSHVSSFASTNLQNNSMNNNSDSIKHSYVQINNNIQQEEDSESEEEYNESQDSEKQDMYGSNLFKQCLQELDKHHKTLLDRTNTIRKYISDQKTCTLSRFLENKKKGIDLHYNGKFLIANISETILKAEKQKLKNDKLVESNYKQIQNLSKEYKEVCSNIDNITDTIRTLKKKFDDKFKDTNLELSDEDIANGIKPWYNISNSTFDFSNQKISNKHLQEAQNLNKICLTILEQEKKIKIRETNLKGVKKLNEIYTDSIGNKKTKRKEMRENKKKLYEQIKTIKEQNKCIMNVYNEYKKVYDDKYSESFKEFDQIITDVKLINSDEYEQMKRKKDIKNKLSKY